MNKIEHEKKKNHEYIVNLLKTTYTSIYIYNSKFNKTNHKIFWTTNKSHMGLKLTFSIC